MKTHENRWKNQDQKWESERYAKIGKIISTFNCSSLLDVGALSMELKNHIHHTIRYTPLDLYKRSPDCLVADLNKYEFPTGSYDCIAMIGVLEYIYDISWLFKTASNSGKVIIATYNPRSSLFFSPSRTLRNSPFSSLLTFRHRHANGWVNAYSANALIKKFRLSTGFDVLHAAPFCEGAPLLIVGIRP